MLRFQDLLLCRCHSVPVGLRFLPHMQNPTLNLCGARRRVSAFLCAILLLANSAFLTSAQTPATGTVSGRVFNPRSGEYVRNAEVRVAGTNLQTVTGAGGTFRLGNVPAGLAELVVIYVGEEEARQGVQVSAGQTSTVNLEFSASNRLDDGTIEMSEFVVSAELEGNAKALADQRNSMDLGRSIASDVFGDVTEGNVGEFLKYMPGIEMEYVEADTRGPRLGGLNPEYTGVSVDGMKQASADAFVQYGATENGSAGGGGRSFSFEQVSINSIESIEISRVTPANLDADAPAGTINLKTKRAFDRKGRLIKWSVGTGFNSEEFYLGRTRGPDDSGVHRKFKPNMSFNYADSFLDNRLGLLFGYSNSNLYNEQYRAEHTYQRTPTATDPRPQVLTRLRFKDGPKWTNRTTYTGTLDWKASEDLMFSLSAVLNYYEASFYNRNVDFRASNNNTSATNGRATAGGDGLTTYSTTALASNAAQRSVLVGGGNGNKQTDGYTITPKVEWRLGDLLIEGRLSKSYSDNTYGTLRNGVAGNAATNSLNGVEFTATRSNPLSGDWKVVQTGGPGWTDLSNYKNPQMTDDTRHVTDEVNIAALDFTYTLPSRIPWVLRWGAKLRQQTTDSDRTSDVMRWRYNGPGGGSSGSWAEYPSSFIHNPSALGAEYPAPPFGNREDVGRLYLDHPEYFSPSFTTTHYYNATFANVRRFDEDVAALYAMANTKLGNLTIQGGLRWEDTETNSEEFDPLLPSEVEAGGYSVDSNGRATTVEGLDYQFTSRPKVNRKGAYDRLHPSLALKYQLGEKWIFDLGAGHTVRRPEVNKLVGLFTYNEDSEVITAANPGLLPEFADRVAGSAAFYFGGTNNVTLTLSDTKIENLFISDEFTAPEFGIDDPEFDTYTVRTFRNSTDAVRFRSLEFSYRQALTFLPRVLQGTSVFANYTRTYADRRQPGVTPHVISGGIDWRFKKLGLGLKGVWVDDAPWTSTADRYRKGNLKLDGSVDYRINDRVTAYLQVRNITNQDHVVYEAVGDNVPVVWRRENYGSNYVLGLRGSF